MNRTRSVTGIAGRMRRAALAGLAAATLLQHAHAARVAVLGLFPGKAVVSLDGGAPRTLAAGQKIADGMTLAAVGADAATIEAGGRRISLRIGESFGTPGAPAAPSGAANGGDTVVLSADSGGHYVTVGAINDRAVKFFVDTGASMVWMSAEVAKRIGLDYARGQQFQVRTAGGPRSAYAVRLASVRVGSITLTDVEAGVGEGAGTGDTVLLGMSFLSRLSMTRDGNVLRLSRKSAATDDSRDTRPRITLTETRSGLFATTARVNGTVLPFLVDTGATSVSLDAAMAERIGIDYRKGTPGMSQTANGPVRTWRIRLDSLAVGPITVYGVEASILDGPGVGVGLLGMSFLNRVEMRREGETLILVKRF